MEKSKPLQLFWHWFFRGNNSRAGILKFFDRWLLLHLFIGILGTHFVTEDLIELKEIAHVILIPLAGTLVSLSFAWSGFAQALLQTEEIKTFTDNHPDGVYNYIFTFQSIVLVVLITLILWSITATGIFSQFAFSCSWAYDAIKLILFFLTSLTIRECWNSSLSTQYLLVIYHKIRQSRKNLRTKKKF